VTPAIACPQAASSELRAIAYHEAGHVVVGTRLGLEILDTDIERDEEGGRGHTHFAPADAADRGQVERVVTTFMAGFAAEIKLGSADPEGSWYDIDLLQRQWLGYLEPDPQRRPGLVRRFLARAQAELDAPEVWTSVEAVASALLGEVRLDGPRARELATA
jgi:hypothetical protein